MHRPLLLAVLVVAPAVAADPGEAFFEAKIRPLLVQHCYECHGPDKQKGSLRLDSKAAVLKGGDLGPALVPGKPDESRIVQAVRYANADLKMPPNKKLRADQIADLEQWVKSGAADPRTGPAGKESARADWEAVLRERRQWWSLQPLRVVPPPGVADPAWAANPVDRFVRDQSFKAGLGTVPLADRAALARRLSFVLTGLPPSPELVREFLADKSREAVEKLVDRLLASSHFGERWARHWMDVVRYTDTYGYEWDIPAKGAWRYRDYLVRAYNADVPFDRIVREQIAGDLIEPRIDPKERINESLFGPMFFQMGEKRHGDSADFNGIHQEMLHNKIDAFGKAFQAITIGCAQCHDHKLDPISQRDYYALAGMFFSPRWVSVTADTPDRNRETLARLRELKARLRPELARWWLAADLDEALRKVEPPKAPVPLEHPLHGWFAVRGKDVPSAWEAVAKQYAAAHRDRSAANARDFRVIADFSKGLPPGWSADGVGLRDGPVKNGDFTVALAGRGLVGRVLPAGFATDALSPRLNGAIRSPNLRDLDRPFVSLLAGGGDFAAERTIIDNAFLTERQTYLPGPEPTWRVFATRHTEKERRVTIELATKSSNPNFPPRVGLGPALTDEQIEDPRSWFSVSRAHAALGPGLPADDLARFQSLYRTAAPRTIDEARARYVAWLRAAVQAWADDRASEDDVRIVQWLLANKVLPNGEAGEPPAPVKTLVAEYRAAEAQIQLPQTVNGMADIESAEDYRFNVRGDYDRPTDRIPRGYLGVFDGPRAVGTASGRKELADFVASAKNPLTARVYVNRVWHWVFGAGLVATPDDFGKIGERPSHPELLDWLADWFIQNGWSTKKLVRLLVTSRAFRQASTPNPRAVTVDPTNRLLHHYPLRRLEAEAVRDAMLSASGRLDPRLYGPTMNPHRTAEDKEKRLFSGPVDGLGRRSIYTKVTIMEPPKFLAAFNQPPPKIPTGKRDVTNVPAQALALLNDPFVVGQADHWGASLAKQVDASVDARLEGVFQRAFGRPPTTEERRRWAEAVGDFAALHKVPPGDVLRSAAVWKDVAHAMFNTKEFIYLR